MRALFKSVEWMLAAAAGVFFVFGRFVAPYYEELFAQMSPDEERIRISVFCLWLAGILTGLLLFRLVWRLKPR